MTVDNRKSIRTFTKIQNILNIRFISQALFTNDKATSEHLITPEVSEIGERDRRTKVAKEDSDLKEDIKD